MIIIISFVNYHCYFVPHVTCHMSHATCYMLHVTCHMSHSTCHMTHVTYHMLTTSSTLVRPQTHARLSISHHCITPSVCYLLYDDIDTVETAIKFIWIPCANEFLCKITEFTDFRELIKTSIMNKSFDAQTICFHFQTWKPRLLQLQIESVSLRFVYFTWLSLQ